RDITRYRDARAVAHDALDSVWDPARPWRRVLCEPRASKPLVSGLGARRSDICADGFGTRRDGCPCGLDPIQTSRANRSDGSLTPGLGRRGFRCQDVSCYYPRCKNTVRDASCLYTPKELEPTTR